MRLELPYWKHRYSIFLGNDVGALAWWQGRAFVGWILYVVAISRRVGYLIGLRYEQIGVFAELDESVDLGGC